MYDNEDVVKIIDIRKEFHMRLWPRATRIIVTSLCVVLGVAANTHATDLNVSPFEFVTRGFIDDGVFQLETRGEIGIQLQSGFLTRSEVLLGVRSESFGKDPFDPATQVVPVIRRAAVTFEELFGTAFNFTYFLGESDRLASGLRFPEAFGTEPIATDFRGYLYFPDGPLYEGLFGVAGTGVRVSSGEQWRRTELSVYTYQDNRFDPGVFSNDIAVMFNLEGVQLEAFAGASYPLGAFGRYRGGLLANFSTPEGDALLAQIGVTGFEPGTGADFGLDDLFFLFEPRVNLGTVGLALTFFWHPGIYDQIENPERGTIDTNLNVRIGNPFEDGVSGGLESRVSIRPESAEQFLVTTGPYLRLNSGTVSWDIRAVFRPVPFDLTELVEGYVGVRTRF